MPKRETCPNCDLPVQGFTFKCQYCGKQICENCIEEHELYYCEDRV